MKNERKFCKCQKCGNIISFVYNSGAGITCCGEIMQELKPNTTDGAKEKHVPVVILNGEKLTVNVGSVAHPMTEDHHIAWIVATSENRTQRVVLQPTALPAVDFIVSSSKPVTVYAYCNLHGLWMTEVN